MSYVFHPMILNDPAIWALPAAEFKLYAALLVFVKPDGSGAFPTNETLAEMVGVNDRSVRRLLAELETKGIIARTSYDKPDGSYHRTITINYVPVIGKGRSTISKSWSPGSDQEVISDHPPVTDDLGGRLPVTGGGRLSVTAEHTHREHSQKNNDDDEERNTLSAESGEPFEHPPGTNPARMPVVSSIPLRQKPSREHFPVQVPREMRDRIYTVLGCDGDTFASRITQEMVDKPGFVDDVLRSAQNGKKPIALAMNLLAGFGNWLSPQERIEKDKEIRNEVFFRKMGLSQ